MQIGLKLLILLLQILNLILKSLFRSLMIELGLIEEILVLGYEHTFASIDGLDNFAIHGALIPHLQNITHGGVAQIV